MPHGSRAGAVATAVAGVFLGGVLVINKQEPTIRESFLTVTAEKGGGGVYAVCPASESSCFHG
jgi:hypothetical protein